MKKLEILFKVLLVIVVVAGCVYGGRVEYNDYVISSMSAEKYDAISEYVGSDSRSAIVKEYTSRQKFWDDEIR